MLVISSPFNFYAYFIYSLHSLESQKEIKFLLLISIQF